MAGNYKKESVELTFVYLLKVVERPDQNKRYNAPHLDSMRYMYTERVQPHSYTRNECYSFILWSRKLPHFQQGLRKHFQYVCYLSNSTTKLSKFSETNNTLRDIVQR